VSCGNCLKKSIQIINHLIINLKFGKGFVLVSKGSDCFESDNHNLRELSLSGRGKYCFTVIEPPALAQTISSTEIGMENENKVQVIFSATSDSDRQDWLDQLQLACDGFSHSLSSEAFGQSKNQSIALKQGLGMGSNGSPEKIIGKSSKLLKKAEVLTDYPKKSGPLMKETRGKKFGVKTTKKRWFKLDAGELRYYGDEQMKPSQLKDTIQLLGCQIFQESKSSSLVITCSDGSSVELIADSANAAKDWCTALRDTVQLLNPTVCKDKQRRIDLVADSSTSTVALTKNTKTSGGEVYEVFYKAESSKNLIRKALQGHFLLGAATDVDPIMDVLQLQIVLPGDLYCYRSV